MANNFTLLCSLHLLLSSCFCLRVSLEQNINLVHEILFMKYAFKKSSAQNIFGRKHNDENFSHELFGIEMNANENKAKYGKQIFAVPSQFFPFQWALCKPGLLLKTHPLQDLTAVHSDVIYAFSTNRQQQRLQSWLPERWAAVHISWWTRQHRHACEYG